MNIQLPIKFSNIFTEKARYRIWYGGRGSSKSHSIARALLILGMKSSKRILCCREYQSSIADSSHRLLCDMIYLYKLEKFYSITKTEIKGANGTLFIFRGIKVDPHGIKSLEGVDVAWCEESEKISNESLDILIPTIRKPESELWFSFNPFKDQDPVYQRFVLNPPPNSIVVKVNYNDNPWFPDVLKNEMEHDKRTNPDRYRWIWEGECLGISDAQVFRGKYEVQDFGDPPPGTFLHYGVDWGFSVDPSTMIRCWILDRKLYIDYEAYGVHTELEDLPALFDQVPSAREWTSYADSARPETISYCQRHSYPNMVGVEKPKGSIEDGIAFMLSFEKIIIHPRCKHAFEEFTLYQYKTDKQTGKVTPDLIDKNNHIIDAIRYALFDRISAGNISLLDVI
jgi:phage terminase large subunit